MDRACTLALELEGQSESRSGGDGDDGCDEHPGAGDEGRGGPCGVNVVVEVVAGEPVAEVGFRRGELEPEPVAGGCGEVGVGLKAKLGLNASKPLSASVALGFNATTGDFGLNGKLSMAAWDLALKGAVGLFAYYDAIGVSTYSKDWWLYERTLGKMTLAGLDFPFSVTRRGGFQGKVEPKPLDLQDMEGNVRSAFPSRG